MLRDSETQRLVPYGLMIGGHVCPIDHGYFYPKSLKPGQEHFDVFAPADGFVVVVGHCTQLIGSTSSAFEQLGHAHDAERSRRATVIERAEEQEYELGEGD